MKKEMIVELISMLIGGEESAKSDLNRTFVGEYVIARTYSAGVHVGTLKERSGTEAVLTDVRRLYRWAGAFTLNEVAEKGIDLNNSKICTPVKSIFLSQVIEVIPCCRATQDQISGAKTYEP